MKDKINIQLIKFIENFSGTYDFIFTKSTSIENDLGITGDDGHDLIKEYSKTFNVDISDFKFENYFYPEPSHFIDYKKIKIKPLTIGDLENAIIKGYLM